MKERILLVRVVIKTLDNRVLLLERSTESTWSPHKFELPGGKINLEAESVPEAVRREVHEETGMTLSSDPPVFHMLTEEWQGREYIIAAYFVEVDHPVQVILSKEHSIYRWVSLSDLQQISVTSHTLEILRKAFEVFTTSVNDKTTTKIEDKKSSFSELIIYTDGGSRGNPGPSASGYVIMDGKQTVLEEGGEYLGITTNNQAEYQAVKLALEQAAKYHARHITFRVDSELVAKQMQGQYQIRNRDLWPVHGNIKELIASYQQVTFEHIRRELNTLADSKVNEILDSHRETA